MNGEAERSWYTIKSHYFFDNTTISMIPGDVSDEKLIENLGYDLSLPPSRSLLSLTSPEDMSYCALCKSSIGNWNINVK